jgi:hypothetical protein
MLTFLDLKTFTHIKKQSSRNACLELLPSDLYAKYHSTVALKSVNTITNNNLLEVNSKLNRLAGQNIVLALNRRLMDTRMEKCSIIQPELYSSMNMHRRILGHLSAVYCVCFDRTGKYTLTVC